MAETDKTNTQQPQAQQGRPCPKDCRKCSWLQQMCCSAMMSFDTFSVLSTMIQKIDAQSVKIAELGLRIEALQPNDTSLSTPDHIQGNLFSEEK